jgi:hypothetical protein
MGGSKGGTQVTERALTKEELRLLRTQEESLKQATDVATQQWNLSKEDREYFDKIYRGGADINSPEFKAEVTKRLEGLKKPTYEQFVQSSKPNRDDFETDKGYNNAIAEWKKTGEDEYKSAMEDWESKKSTIVNTVKNEMSTGKSVDEILFDAVKSSDTRISEQLDKWQESSSKLGTEFTGELKGLSEGFRNKISNAYQKMGTADEDIYAQTKGQELAGISQAYAEAQKQLSGSMAQRGLADSGVDIQGVTSLANQEAMAKAQGFSRAYTGAIQQSDIRRQNQMALAGQEYQVGTGVAQTAYGVQSGLLTADLQNRLNAQQQNIANLQMTSGVSQGVYGGAQNYLNQAGNTSNQSAQVAGSTAVGIGSNATVTEQKGESGLGSILQGAGGFMMGAAKLSDFRFKNNIKLIKEVNGIRLYTWEWNDFAIEYCSELYEPYGVIAQELLVSHPEYVFEDENGYYVVDYDGLNKDFNLGV